MGRRHALSLTPLRAPQVSARVAVGSCGSRPSFLGGLPGLLDCLPLERLSFRFGDTVTKVAVENHVPFPLSGAAAGTSGPCHSVPFTVVSPVGWRKVPLCLVTLCSASDVNVTVPVFFNVCVMHLFLFLLSTYLCH